MASAPTYTPIATQTVSGSSTNAITFGSIPQTYTDLRVIAQLQTTSSGNVSDMAISLNGDTTSGLYSSTRVYANGSSYTSDRQSNVNYWNQNGVNASTAGWPGIASFDFMNYSSSSTYKTVLLRDNTVGYYTMMLALLWRNANAITSITIGANSGQTLYSGSTFTLYGIAAA